MHYCVANIPGAVARTSTLGLTSATLPYVVRVAAHGVAGAAARDPVLAKGLSTLGGKLVSRPVAEAHRPALPGPGHRPVGGPSDRPEPHLIPAARTSALTSYLIVELPGIEPVTETNVTCGNAEYNYAKRRETTRNDLRIRGRC